MAVLIEREIKHAEASGDKKLAKLTGGVPNVEVSGFMIGDEWTMPEKYEYFAKNLGGKDVPYIFVEVTNNGEKTVKQLFISMFVKRRSVVNEDGSRTGRMIFTQGSAAEKFRDNATFEEAMNSLKGLTMKITAMDPVYCIRYGTTKDVILSDIPTIDLVEPKKKK